MIRRESQDGTARLVITRPIGEQTFALAALILVGYYWLWYSGIPSFPDAKTPLHVFLSLLAIILALSSMTTKVVVGPTWIQERRFKWRTIQLSRPAVVDKPGQWVRILSSSGEVQYRFSRFLNHGDSLEETLRDFFRGESTAA